MMLPPIDQIRRETSILSQYGQDDDKLFHACQMAGISVCGLRAESGGVEQSARRRHVVLLLRLSDFSLAKTAATSFKSKDFICRVWAARLVQERAA